MENKRSILLLALLTLISLTKGYLSSEDISEISSKTKLWTGSLESSNIFSTGPKEMSFNGAKKKQYLPSSSAPSTPDTPISSSLPESIDWRQLRPECMSNIRMQLFCGSCWTFSVTEAVSDRFCIHSQGTLMVELSPQYLLACIHGQSEGCGGGYPIDAYMYLEQHGTPEDLCLMYYDFIGISWPTCFDFCFPLFWVSDFKYYVRDATPIVDRNVDRIKTALLDGPVTAGMVLYKDFTAYKEGIYENTTDEIVGYHAVKVVGYGYDQEKDVEYWIAANSWGAGWGEDGYFRIKFGVAEFEDDLSFAHPIISE
jgi:cathepsin B